MESISIDRDAIVMATDGELGRVKHVIVDADTREVTDLVVGRGGEEWVIPMRAVAGLDDDRIMLNGARAQFRAAPAFHRDEFQALDDKQAERESAGVATHGGAPLREADDHGVVVGDEPPADVIGRRAGDAETVADETENEDGYDAPNPQVRTLTGDQPEHLQLREERLRVEKEEVEAGVVRLTKRVREWVETVDVPLREEQLVVEVLPGSGVVRFGDQELQAGDVLEVPLLEERATVVKETVVSEDVTVRKVSAEVEEQFQETLRREELAIEESGNLDVTDQDLADYETQQAGRDR